MKKTIIRLAVILMLFSCERVTNPQTDYPAAESFLLGDTVRIDFNQKMYNNHEDVSLGFTALISDGRCPVDLHCFWEGNAEVKFLLEAESGKSEINLNTYWRFRRDTVLSDYHIQLLNLTPRPHSDSTFHQEQYQAFLVVSHE